MWLEGRINELCQKFISFRLGFIPFPIFKGRLFLKILEIALFHGPENSFNSDITPLA